MKSCAIECVAVVKRYGGTVAVKGVSLQVEAGRILALLGPSGCGKTTLLRTIAGFERPDEGTISICGRVVVGPGVWVPPEKRRIGFVFQDYALFPHMTVGANVAFGVRGASRKERRARVEKMLELVGLAGKASSWPHELSGGQQQRVAIARALAPDPGFLLLDEPFSNLDAGLRRQVREDVHRILDAAGAAAIFVTHDQEEALNLGSAVAVMHEGRIVEVATPREIYLNPRLRETAEIVGAANLLAGESMGVSVRCALGRLPLAHPCRTGPMDVLVRPESIRLEPCAPPPAAGGHASGIHATGIVEDLQFHGNHQHVRVRLPGGERLRVKVAPEQRLQVEQTVEIRVPDPVVCFARDGTSRNDSEHG